MDLSDFCQFLVFITYNNIWKLSFVIMFNYYKFPFAFFDFMDLDLKKKCDDISLLDYRKNCFYEKYQIS